MGGGGCIREECTISAFCWTRPVWGKAPTRYSFSCVASTLVRCSAIIDGCAMFFWKMFGLSLV